MKATIDKDYARNFLTLAELDAAKLTQKALKDYADNESSAMKYGASAYCRVNDMYLEEVISASAEINMNGRLDYDYFGDGTRRCDAWVKGMFKCATSVDGKLVRQIVEMGFYYSDGLSLCYDDMDTYRTLVDHAYCVVYQAIK